MFVDRTVDTVLFEDADQEGIVDTFLVHNKGKENHL